MSLMLYGAYGYTGKLILEEAQRRGMQLLLAGRSREKLEPLAESAKLPFRVFDLQAPGDIGKQLSGVTAVIHAAGPFKYTARPMIEACLQAGVHYLDITGEIEVFELAAQYGTRAAKAGIMLLPGAGFDVVPTDCLALFLKRQLPDATHLQLAFSALGGGVSRGTATTMAENLGKKGAVRRDGEISLVPIGHKTRTVPFKGKKRFAMTIPWGDVSTAWYSTGIPNIETYMGISPKAYRWVKWQRRLGWLLRQDWVRRQVKKRIRKRPPGPSEEQRRTSQSLVWGQVSNDKGAVRQARLTCPEGYTLTAFFACHIAEKVLAGQAPVGFQTPAKAYGADLILEMEGSERELLHSETGHFEPA